LKNQGIIILIILRYCLNWGCVNNKFKEVDNKIGACHCHIGVWDHGSTGTKMTQFVKEFGLGPKERKNLSKVTVMWEPHWTCCRGEWATPGKFKQLI